MSRATRPMEANRSMPLQIDRWLPLMLVTLAALFLRTYDLGRRPMHADEANQAVKTGELLEQGHYAFDPADHHGPTLYYAALPIAWLRGQSTLASLDEITVRLVPALAGTAAVLLLGLFAAPLGKWPALIAAAFFAVSPPAVYYSRDFIQETLLVAFTLGALLCARHWWRSGSAGWVLGLGVCAGLMQATKASAPLFGLAAVIALLAARINRPAAVHPWRQLGLAASAAFIVVALFYTSFGTHLAGLRDAILTYGQRMHRLGGGSGQEKPWWYYLQLFTWQRSGGLVWEQLAFFVCAIAGGVVAVRSRQAILRWAAVYTAIIAVVLSFTPYKTPWHAVHLVPGLALLAAGALAALPRAWLSGLAAAVVMTCLAWQTRLVAFVRPAEARNPYAYVHSSPDVLKFRSLAESARVAAPAAVVRVIGEEYWPLPWYFRGLLDVGYWSTPPAECDGAIVFVSATLADVVRTKLHGSYRENYLGLRPGVTFVVFTPRSQASAK